MKQDIKTYKYISVLIISFFLCSCEKNAFLDQGDKVTEIRTIDPFIKIEVYDIFNIFLVQNSSPQITINAGENVIPQIRTYVRNDTLFISNESQYRWSRKYSRINLHINIDESFDKITLNTASNLQTIETISGDNLTIWAIGDLAEIDISIDYNYFHFADAKTSTGKFIFKGEVETAYLWGRGSCHIIANELLVNYLRIHNGSIGDCHVYAIDELKYQIDNIGNIYYLGSPADIIELSTSSSGQLIQKND